METNLKLKLLTWNANSITPRKLELQRTLNYHNLDVAMISKFYLTPTKYIKIFSYKAYQSNHPNTTTHAGSVILVKNKIIQSPFPITSET